MKLHLGLNVKRIFKSPIMAFVVGCMMFMNGLILWLTDTLPNLEGLIRLFVTGVFLLVGFIEIGSNYQYIIDSSYRKQYKKDMQKIEFDKIKFDKMMDEHNRENVQPK